MGTVRQDFVYAVRMLLKSPRLTVVGVLSLAIGIGANTAIFSVTNALLLRPLPYKDADRLVILWNRSPGLNVAQDWFSPGQYLDVKADNTVFDKVAATIDSSFNVTGQGTPERVEGARVSSSLFEVLGAQPLMGRVFTPDEDQQGKPPTAILSYGFWQRHFGGQQSVIGKTMMLNGNPVEIVGVMPREFILNKDVMPTVNKISNAELLLSLPFAGTARNIRTNEDYNIFGKLRAGVSTTQAQADVDRIVATMKQQYPANYPASSGFLISVVPLQQQVVGDVRKPLLILLCSVGVMLLIACANVGNLQLARASARQKEIAIRSAVGASRWRIVRQLLTESVLTGLAGGLLGLLIAWVGLKLLLRLPPNTLPLMNGVTIDLKVLGFTFLISIVSGVLFGLAPSLQTSRVDLNRDLKEGQRTSTNVIHRRLRNALVIVELSLSLVLLIGAGLLLRSYRQIQNARPGFDAHNALSFRLSLPNSKYKGVAVTNFYKTLREKIGVLPGVEAVGTAYSLPMSSVALAWGPITIENYIPRNSAEIVMSNERFVSPGYFPAMGVPLVKGRLFDEHDVKGAQETVIVNEALAQRFWSNEDPIGKRLQRAGQDGWRTVVGVVRDSKEFSVDDEPPISIYHPHDQFPIGTMFLVVRSTNDPSLLISAITKEVHSLDPELPAYEFKTMDQRVSESMARRRFSTSLLTVFATVSLMLAAMGIYGLMSYSVSQRTSEIGIRMALGARPGSITWLIFKQALGLVLLGSAIGLGGAFALTRVMSSLLYGVSATDALAFAVPPIVLGMIGLLASYVPARRAARVDPTVALRSE